MSLNPMRTLRTLCLSLFAVSFVGCSSMQTGLPAGLTNVLGQVTGLSSSIAGWQSSLGGMLDNSGLGQLKQYADQAGELGSSISSMQDSVSDAMANPLGAIGGKLQEMSGIDVDSLRTMVPSDQMKAVEGFSQSAGSVGDMASDFMQQFGG